MIQILITGGTFDKSYNHISGDLFFDKTHIPEMLKRSKCRLNIEVKTLMMIDSLEMTNKDIEQIIDECQKSSSSRIVITHGTDTMVNTAKKIAEKIKNTYLKENIYYIEPNIEFHKEFIISKFSDIKDQIDLAFILVNHREFQKYKWSENTQVTSFVNDLT